MSDALERLRIQAEAAVARVESRNQEVCEAQSDLRTIVLDYNVERSELIEAAMIAAGKAWCTRCRQLAPTEEMSYLWTEGNRREEGGYENSCYWYERFGELHHVCARCRQRCLDRHGWQDTTYSDPEKQASFYAFVVERREDDGYYARKFGDWTGLEATEPPEPDSYYEDQIAKQLGLPPRLRVHNGQLVSDKSGAEKP